jgi:hypothetical protein
MKNVALVAVAVLLAGVAQPFGAVKAAGAEARVAAGPVKVTVTYKGKGTVDASHKIWVWLFDTPNIGAGSMPLDQKTIETNGGEVTFDVSNPQVYIAVAFDESGSMTGDAPPPPGTPISIWMGKDGAPAGVTPGEKGTVTLVFTDAMRMQ